MKDVQSKQVELMVTVHNMIERSHMARYLLQLIKCCAWKRSRRRCCL